MRHFSGSSAFDQPLSTWDTSSVTDMEHLFSDKILLNQEVSAWDVYKVETMYKHVFRSSFLC
jgi:surface protein